MVDSSGSEICNQIFYLFIRRVSLNLIEMLILPTGTTADILFGRMLVVAGTVFANIFVLRLFVEKTVVGK